ncbi:hypothetical protein [Paraburkholderia sp. A3RO-2L]|jgi:hypothetical protein|uniref:hypothetical protein n=1 Tax=unclassified Paraburkholderia TaxID=2615204 RepID=UPI003DA80F03
MHHKLAVISIGLLLIGLVLSHYGVLLSVISQLKQARRDLEERLELDELIRKQIERVLWSWRDVFDHLPTYVPMDERLSGLLFTLARGLPGYVADLGTKVFDDEGLVTCDRECALPVLFHDGGPADQLVKAVNDPVMNALWAVRSPQAVSEMLRHGLFLALGYPLAVMEWSRDGINIELPEMRDPGYTNWGCKRADWYVEQLEGFWKAWLTATPTSAERRAGVGLLETETQKEKKDTA